MTVETTRVEAVLQHNLPVLDQRPIGLRAATTESCGSRHSGTCRRLPRTPVAGGAGARAWNPSPRQERPWAVTRDSEKGAGEVPAGRQKPGSWPGPTRAGVLITVRSSRSDIRQPQRPPRRTRTAAPQRGERHRRRAAHSSASFRVGTIMDIAIRLCQSVGAAVDAKISARPTRLIPAAEEVAHWAAKNPTASGQNG